MEAKFDARKPRSSLVRLARWWRTATQAERLEAVKASIRGDSEAPPLETLHVAILTAECEAEAARERERRSEALHGEAATHA